MNNKLKLTSFIVIVGLIYWSFVCGLGGTILNLSYAKYSITFTGLLIGLLHKSFRYVVLVVASILYIRMENKLICEGKLTNYTIRKFSLIVWVITNVVLSIAARIYMKIAYIDGDDYYGVNEYETEYSFFWMYIILAAVVVPGIVYVYKVIKNKKDSISLSGGADKEQNEELEVVDAKECESSNADIKKSLWKFSIRASIMTLVVWILLWAARLIHNVSKTYIISELLIVIAMLIPIVWVIVFMKKEKSISERYSVSGKMLFYRAWWVVCLEYYVIGTVLSVLYKTCLEHKIGSEYGTFAMETIILYSAFVWMLRGLARIRRCSNKVLKVLLMILSIIAIILVGMTIIIDMRYFSAILLS